MTEKKKNYCVIMVGLPCSGKSTFIEKNFLPHFEETVVVSSDNIIQEVATRRDMTYNEAFMDKTIVSGAMQSFWTNLNDAFNKRKPLIVVDRTNMSIWSRRKIIREIPVSYHVIIYDFTCPFEEILERNQNREGKIIPMDIMLSMNKSYETPEVHEADAIIRVNTSKKATYKPLPTGLIVGKSDINGQGLINEGFLHTGQRLGITHYFTKHGIIRTPLGGFINHSDTPNCEKREVISYANDRVSTSMELVVTENIFPGEELTSRYTLYEV